MTKQPEIIITDSSVLVNFLAVDRMDLLAAHTNQFVITDHVADEITYAYPERYDRFMDSIRLGSITKISVNDPVEVELFMRLSSERRLGNGECSAIAVASHRGCTLAIDDRKAIKRAHSLNHALAIVTTKDIIVDCIQQGILDVQTADSIKNDWAQNHKFSLNISSFQDILPRK